MALDYRATQNIRPPEIDDPALAYGRALTNRRGEQILEEGAFQLEENKARAQEARAQRMKAARVSQIMAQARTPYEGAKQLEQEVPDMADAVKGQLADHAAKMLQGVTSYQALPSAWQDIKRYVGEDTPMPEFQTQADFDKWKHDQILAHVDAKTFLEQTKPVAQSVATHVVGGNLVDNTGKVLFTAPEKPAAKTANLGSFEDYIQRTYGDNPTSEQILEGRRKFNQSDDHPGVTVRMGNGMTPGQAFTAERQLRNDFSRETKSAQTVAQQLALMESSLAAVKAGKSPAGSQGVLVTFQKILDPTSVVRESEYARSASGLSLMGQIEGKWAQIQNGGAGVTAKDLEQFVQLARVFAKNQKAFADQTKAQIDAAAKEYGLDPKRITKEIGAVGADTSTDVVSPPPSKPSQNPFRR